MTLHSVTAPQRIPYGYVGYMREGICSAAVCVRPDLFTGHGTCLGTNWGRAGARVQAVVMCDCQYCHTLVPHSALYINDQAGFRDRDRITGDTIQICDLCFDLSTHHATFIERQPIPAGATT